MKKSLIIGLLGLATSMATSFGQGVILLDNYNLGPGIVTYGQANEPANGVSGASGTVGTGLLAGWTMGLYYVVGNATGSVGADPSGTADPATLGGGLTLGSGGGSTAAFFTSSGTPGQALGGAVFAVPGTAATGGDTVTFVLVAYNGASYANAGYRGHSAAFTRPLSANNSPAPNSTGLPTSFGVFAVPEPSIFALSGLGAAALMLVRRKK